MAADQFTQIANTLFRDERLSLKAKGLFGLISTHRDGYGVTPRSLSAQTADGLDAIKSGLRELESAGYLMRSQERRPNGTLGPMEYLITDLSGPGNTWSGPVEENPSPAPTSTNTQNRRSGPVRENPPAVQPPAAHPTPKNTNTKNTSSKNPTPPPGDRAAAAIPSSTEPDATSTTGHGGRATAVATAGPLLLWEVSDRVPGLTFTGAAAARLGAKLDRLLATGWSRDRLLLALTADTANLTHPRGAVAWRIDDLLNTPAPPSKGHGPQSDDAAGPRVETALHRRVYRECPGDDGLCGRPLRGAADLCPACLESEDGIRHQDPDPLQPGQTQNAGPAAAALGGKLLTVRKQGPC
jgi:hypothetical protein